MGKKDANIIVKLTTP